MIDAYTRLLATGFEQPRHAVASVKRTTKPVDQSVWVPLQVDEREPARAAA